MDDKSNTTPSLQSQIAEICLAQAIRAAAAQCPSEILRYMLNADAKVNSWIHAVLIGGCRRSPQESLAQRALDSSMIRKCQGLLKAILSAALFRRTIVYHHADDKVTLQLGVTTKWYHMGHQTWAS